MGIKRGSAVKKRSSKGAAPQWEEATTEPRRCVHLSLYGETGTGKTTLALTAPGPIALIHASEKLAGIVEPHVKDKEIKLYDFGGIFIGSPDEVSAQADAGLADLKAAMDDAWSWAKTIIIDTHTEMWELIRLARFGKLAQVKPHHYGPVNAEWASIFKAFRKQEHVNIITIGHMREQYRNDKPTGIMEMAGQKKMAYMSDVVVRMERSPQLEFIAEVEKGWWNAHVEGMEFYDEEITFPAIMSMITETPEEEWQ